MDKINLYWAVYKNLEKEILELSYHIHFCDTQCDVFSVQIAEIRIYIKGNLTKRGWKHISAIFAHNFV